MYQRVTAVGYVRWVAAFHPLRVALSYSKEIGTNAASAPLLLSKDLALISQRFSEVPLGFLSFTVPRVRERHTNGRVCGREETRGSCGVKRCVRHVLRCRVTRGEIVLCAGLLQA